MVRKSLETFQFLYPCEFIFKHLFTDCFILDYCTWMVNLITVFPAKAKESSNHELMTTGADWMGIPHSEVVPEMETELVTR